MLFSRLDVADLLVQPLYIAGMFCATSFRRPVLYAAFLVVVFHSRTNLCSLIGLNATPECAAQNCHLLVEITPVAKEKAEATSVFLSCHVLEFSHLLDGIFEGRLVSFVVA
jgi:hypothetical protein